MKIVHLSTSPLAGFPYRLSRALQAHTEHESRHVVDYDGYGTRTFPLDLCKRRPADVGEIESVLSAADLYVLHSYFSPKKNRWDIDRRLNHPGRKVTAHYCVRQDRANLDLYNSRIPTTVSAQYHARFFPNSVVAPNIMPIREPLYTPVARAWPPEVPLRVAFSPSTRADQGRGSVDPWTGKGDVPTKKILEQIKRQHPGKFEFTIIESVPLEECLRMRSLCHVSIDEVVTGSYHNVHLEGMSQGLLSVVFTDPETLKAIEKVTGPEGVSEPPWVITRIDGLQEALMSFLDGAGRLRERAEACRTWMETHWDDVKMAKIYSDFYDTIPPYR